MPIFSQILHGFIYCKAVLGNVNTPDLLLFEIVLAILVSLFSIKMLELACQYLQIYPTEIFIMI